MSIQVQGNAGVVQEVDVDRRQLITPRGPSYGALGAYSVVVTSGDIAATLGAASTLFSVRWGNASNLMVIEYIAVSAVVDGIVTAGVVFDLEAIIARSFTVSDSAQTAVTLTGDNQKRRTNMGTSLITDMRVANTAGITVGTRTVDANALGRVQGFTGTAVGTRIFDNQPAPLWDSRGIQNAIVLAQNEGLLIRNPLAGPATGTVKIMVALQWVETAAYLQ